MKRFQFSLQAVLTLRQRAEQNALEAYARALLARQLALELLEKVHRQQSEWWAHWRHEVARGCSVGALAQWRACNSTLTAQVKEAEASLSHAESILDEAMKKVIAARRDREAVEKHGQRQRQKHRNEVSREEQRMLDELAQHRSLATVDLTRTQMADV